ncbi:MAG: GNAT family N-acetyltransferase [Saprospirales bacterium]|nr:GNAT family N-acetyltransferase [Saprospirales bacterium]
MASLASPMTASWQRDLDIPLRAAMCRSSHTTIRRDIPSQLLSVEGISYKIFSAIDQALGAWKAVEPTDNCFLGADYLRAVEQAPPEGVTPYYIVFFKEDQAAGLAYLQLIDFRADESLQWPEVQGVLPRFSQKMRKKAVSLLRFRLLHLGNVLLTGPRGYWFLPEIVEEKEAHQILAAALPAVRQHLQRHMGRAVDAYVVKDVPEDAAPTDVWTENGYAELCFLPNMLFSIDPAWNSFDHYLASLHSKYRVRARRASRLLDGVEVRELEAEEIYFRKEALFALYQEIAQSVSFNMTTLHPDYFSALKSELGDAFHLTAYFLKGKLVGFYTTIENEEELEAHFIGFDQEINREHQLYLNMLFRMIRDGIDLGAAQISFARTAMEIKSSVGAVAEQFKCYIRHRSSFTNVIVRPLIELLWPDEAWEARHPFR